MVNSSVPLSEKGELETLRATYAVELAQTFQSISTKEGLLEQIELGQTWTSVETAHRDRGHDFVYQGIAFVVNLVRQVRNNPGYEAVFEEECEKRKIGKPDASANPYTPYIAAVFGSWEGTEPSTRVWVKNKTWTNLGGVVRYMVENHITPSDVVAHIKAAREIDQDGEERTRLEAIKVRDRKAHPPKVNSGKTAFGNDENRRRVMTMKAMVTASGDANKVEPNNEGLTLMVARVTQGGDVEVLYDAKLGHDIIMRGVRKGLEK